MPPESLFSDAATALPCAEVNALLEVEDDDFVVVVVGFGDVFVTKLPHLIARVGAV